MTAILLEIILNVVAPVGLCAAVGFAWARVGQPFETTMVTKLVTNVGLPCLVFSTLITVDLDLDAFAVMGFAALVTTLAFMLIGWLSLKALKLSVRTYLNPISFANTGNMGLPLCLLAFGDAGLALGIAYFVVNILIMVTLGIAVASASYRPQDVFRQPVVYGSAASIFVMATEVEVPNMIAKTAGLLGDFTIPLMLITLGVSLARLKIENLPTSVLISGMRLGFGLLIGFGAALLLGLTGTERAVLIIMCAMPVAVIAFLLAEAYGSDSRAVAGSVIVSTLMAFAILPPLLWHLME